MKPILLIIFLLTIVKVSASAADQKFDSNTSTVYDLKIDEGKLIVFTPNLPLIRRQITSQLSFLVGYFNHFNSGPLLSHAKFNIESVKEDTTGRGKYLVTYSALVPVAWTNRKKAPTHFEVILPNRSGPQFFENLLSEFKDGSLSDCREQNESLSVVNLFYHYRPQRRNCNFSDDTIANRFAFKLDASFSPSKLQTSNKSPEYARIWDDGLLDILLVFAKDKIGNRDYYDNGSLSYYQTFKKLNKTFDQLISSNVDFNWSLRNNMQRFIENEYLLEDNRRVRLRILLVDRITIATSSEIEKIKKYSAEADYVMYNGHAGLGSNIDRFMSLVEFDKSKYQIYFLNGCDTFSYYPSSAMTKVERTNTGDKASKWVDLITNAMPSYFNSMASNTTKMVEALIDGKVTYKEILKEIDDYQNATVMGEEDNI